MALLGMQADIDQKSYYPGHYSTRDLNLGSNGSIWPLNNVDTILMNGHYYNDTSSPPSPNQHVVHNKEVLKQTMLKHEATFRDQIRELHRLYWRQRELMDGSRSDELLKHHLQLETLQANPLLSQSSCDYVQKASSFLNLPLMNPASSQLSVSTTENNSFLSSSYKEKKLHTGCDLARTEFSSKNCELDSKNKKFGKKILDLELPAYEFIDSEEEESIEKSPQMSCLADLNEPLKLEEEGHPVSTLLADLNQPFKLEEEAAPMSKLVADLNQPIEFEEEAVLMSKLLADLNEPIELQEEAAPIFKFLADLNEPIELQEEAAPTSKLLADLNVPIELHEEATSMSSDFPSSFTDHSEFPCQNMSQKSNPGCQVFSMNNEAEQSGSEVASLSPVFSEKEASTYKLEEEAFPMSKLLADLKEPVKLQEEAASVSGEFPVPFTGHSEFPCQNLSQKSNPGFQVFSMNLIKDTEIRRDPETCSNGLHLEESKMQEWASYDDEAEQSEVASLSPVISEKEVSTSLEDDLKQADKFPMSFLMDCSKSKSCSEGLESLRREVSSNGYSEPVSTSYMGNSCQLISLTDVGNSDASSVSSWRKHVRDFVRTPIVVQALPCFSNSVKLRKRSQSSITSSRLADKKSHHNKTSKSIPKTLFHQNSFCNGSHSESKTPDSHTPSINFDGLDCSNDNDLASEHHQPRKFVKRSIDMKPAEDMNFNFMSFSCSSNGKKNLKYSTRGLPWLKTQSIQKGKRSKRSRSSSQVVSALLKAISASIFDVEQKEVEASNSSSGKRLFEYTISNEPHMSNGQSSSHSSPSKTPQNSSEDKEMENGEKDRVTDVNLDFDPVPKSGEQTTSTKVVAGSGVDKTYSGFGVGIDLKSCIDGHESSPTPTVSTALDLEPASPENKESSPPRGESDENQVETPIQMSGQEDGDVQEDIVVNVAEVIMSGQEGREMQEELVRNAAKTIVSISSMFQSCQEMVDCEPSEHFPSDDLYWFARVVSLVIDDSDSEFGVVLSGKDSEDCEEYLSSGLDYFEAMTLKLNETKAEEYWCKSNEQKDQKEEESGLTSLTSQPSRGRTRRGRQQRTDFQSVILPSLASLSRYEVTEDLQMIEGLIEATIDHHGTSSKRNVGRNARGRGRRRACVSTSKVTETTTCSMSKRQTGCGEKGTEEIGWGKITRRRRGPRCAASNPQQLIQE